MNDPMPSRASTTLADFCRADVEIGTIARIDVIDDRSMIQAFLGTYARHSRHTVRSYQKEVMRFWVWLQADGGVSFHRLPVVDAKTVNAYLSQLADPKPIPESIMRAAGLTKPLFKRGLSPASMALSITILRQFFEFLRNEPGEDGRPYCLFNPFLKAHSGMERNEDDIGEALSDLEWQAVQETIEQLPRETIRDRQHYHRTRWIFQLLYRAFLRREEAAGLRMNDFVRTKDGWMIKIFGKGRKRTRIIATQALMEELAHYRISLGLSPTPLPDDDAPAIHPVIEGRRDVAGRLQTINDQVIYLVCVKIFRETADRIEKDHPSAAQRLRFASPHWMRHTGITHAMEAGIDPRYVQSQARHSSPNTTSKYDHKARIRWRSEFELMK